MFRGLRVHRRENSHEGRVQYIAELRQYKLVPGKRDVLIELFEREFVETQEAVGDWLYWVDRGYEF